MYQYVQFTPEVNYNNLKFGYNFLLFITYEINLSYNKYGQAQPQPKPQLQLGADVAIFSTNPATHPEKYERAVKTTYFQNKSCQAM